jgi:hypothetical protein
LQWSWLRRLCAGQRRRRDSHGRWGCHVEGRHDLELRGGACAPVAFARPASLIGELLRYAALLRMTVDATWWVMPRGGCATWWVMPRGGHSCGASRCALQHVVRCMLRGVAPPIDGAVQVRCFACCSFDIVCCMMRAAAAALPMAGTPIDAVQVCCGARCTLFFLLRAVERSPLPLRNICVNAYSDQRSSSIASKRVVRCIGARCMLHRRALHVA